MSRRIEILRKSTLDAEHSKYRKHIQMSVIDKSTEKLPVIQRKALGFVKMLEEMPVYIMEEEIIVGARTLFAPGLKDSNLSKNLDFSPDAETLAVENPGFEFYPSYLTADEKQKASALGIDEGYVTSHCAAGFENVLSCGFGGLKERTLEAKEHRAESGSKTDFLDAALIIIDGIQNFILRYAELAENLAEKESEKNRTDELLKISTVCRKLKNAPASTFHEALQLTWFTHLFMLIENYNLMSLGRPDQYLYSYFQNDIKNRTITREEALELLSCFFIKLNDTSDLHTDNGLNIIISGLKPDGQDGTNELSWLFIDAYENVRLTDPQINIRWNPDIPEDFLQRVMKLKGINPIPPMIFNDEVIIPGLCEMGVLEEDARDYCIDACQDVLIQGKSDFYPIFAGVYGIHLLTVFERTLPKLPEYDDFDAFYRFFLDELKKDVAETAHKANTIDAALPELSPTPVLSLTLEGCIENGMDKTSGGTRYNFTGFIGGGLVNIADSLAAIKKQVFDKKNISTSELLRALKENFDNHEDLRLLLKNRSPKWGNADESVDRYGIEIAEVFANEVLKQKNPRNGRFIPGLMTHHQVRLGKVVKALPDGRKHGDPLAVSLSPSIGQMKKGPTCALKSAASINHKLLPVGTSVDLTLQSSFLKTEQDLQKVITMTETFLQSGGLEVQYNILDPEILRAAQKSPEEYKDLVVRVWGFNAYFVSLQKEYQDELIARTEAGVR